MSHGPSHTANGHGNASEAESDHGFLREGAVQKPMLCFGVLQASPVAFFFSGFLDGVARCAKERGSEGALHHKLVAVHAVARLALMSWEAFASDTEVLCKFWSYGPSCDSLVALDVARA